MKRVAALVLTRNMPALADELGEFILTSSGDLVDLYVVENGSDPDKCSRFANIVFTESFGPARGINEALKIVLQQPYDYFWVNYNDARYTPSTFLPAALELFAQDSRIGIVSGYWRGNVRDYGMLHDATLLSVFEALGFVVSRRALEVTSTWPRVPLDPFWDSSNFTAHFNTLATTLALYDHGMCVVADQRHTLDEYRAPADEDSVTARGFDDAIWKNELGPQQRAAWLQRAFPDLHGSPKQVRHQLITLTEQLIAQHFPEVRHAPPSQRLGVVRRMVRALNLSS